MHPHPHDIAATWLAQASADLESAAWTLTGKRYDVTCFLAQQSAEKALKAVLLLLVGARPRLHLISALMSELAAFDPESQVILEDVVALDVFYTASRYPDAIGGATPAATFKEREAQLAIERAAVAVAFAKSRIVGPDVAGA